MNKIEMVWVFGKLKCNKCMTNTDYENASEVYYTNDEINLVPKCDKCGKIHSGLKCVPSKKEWLVGG